MEAEDVSKNDELVLTGMSLTLKDLVHASRQSNPNVRISADCYEKMTTSRNFAEKLADRGDLVYGLTTGVGVRKNRLISADKMDKYNQKMLRDHATGQGKNIPYDIINASTIILLNTIAAGRSMVRPEIARHIEKQLCKGNLVLFVTRSQVVL